MILLDILANSILVLPPFSFALFDKVCLSKYSPRTVKRAWQMLEARPPFLDCLDEREHEYQKPRVPPYVEPFFASLDHLVYAAQSSAISLIRFEYDEDILNKAQGWHSRSFGQPATAAPFEALVESFHSLLATPFALRDAIYHAIYQKLFLPILPKASPAVSPSALTLAHAYCRCVFTAHLAASLGTWSAYKTLMGLVPMMRGDLDNYAIVPPWLDDDVMPQYFRSTIPPAYEAFLASSAEETWSSDDGATAVLAFADFVTGLTAYKAATQDDTSLLKLSLTLQPRLMADASRKAAVRAEEKLHEAMLDAVLARRNLEMALEDEAVKA